MTVYTYYTTDEDPTIAFRLLNRDGTAPDLSTASAWAVYIVDTADGTLQSTITTVTGYAALQGTSPNDYNALLTFAAGDLATVGAGRFRIDGIQATISARQRSFLLERPPILIVKAIPT